MARPVCVCAPLCAGVLFVSGSALAQFSAYLGDITLDGAPVGPQSNYTGTLGIASGLFESADVWTSAGAVINHTGDLDLATGNSSVGALRVQGAGTVWTTTGSLRAAMNSGEAELWVDQGAEMMIGGNATIGDVNTGVNFDVLVNTGSTMDIAGALGVYADSVFDEVFFTVTGAGARVTSAYAEFSGIDLELSINFGASMETGNFQFQDGNMYVRTFGGGATTLVSAVSFLNDGGAQAYVDGDGASWTADSLLIDNSSQAYVENGGMLSVNGLLDIADPSSRVEIDTGGIVEAGSIGGGLDRIDFRNGTFRLGTGLTIDGSVAADSGFRDIDSTSALEIEGALSAEAPIVLEGHLRAESIGSGQLSNFTGSGSMHLGTVEILEGIDLTSGDTLAPDQISLTFTNVMNNGRVGSALFETFDGGFTNLETGEVVLDPGTRFDHQMSENLGEINMLGRNVLDGDVRFSMYDDFTNAASGRIYAREADIRIAGVFENLGTLGFSHGASSLLGDVDNGGLITITGDGAVTVWDDMHNDGTINLAAGSFSAGAMTVFGTYSGAGGVTGGGDLFLLGDVLIGNSPASVVMDASLFLGATTSTQIEIGGVGDGLFDRVDVTGDLGLDGALDVAFIDGFTLGKNMIFEIFSVGGALSGGFDGVGEGDLVGIYGGQELFITYEHGSGGVALYSVPAPGTLALLGGAMIGVVRRKR